MLQKIEPGSDEFVAEKYAAQISRILAHWSAGLLRSGTDLQVMERALAPDFSGNSIIPSDSRLVRAGPVVEVRQGQFAPRVLGRDEFIRELHKLQGSFTQCLTAEFQVTNVELKLPRVLTRVRYELVGTAPRSFRQQRVGEWEIEWQTSGGEEYRIQQWRPLQETQSRANNPVFADVTASAVGANSSYSSQLQHGVDHWRTVLDGASGIDIYGHNGVAVGDVDGDGFDDLYVCQPAGLPNRLYRNRGDGTFEDITESAGVGVLENTACALFADIDNDGRQDLIVVRTDGPVLFLSQGDGRFQQQRDAFHFGKAPQGTFTGAALADYDRDGWLDIYFCLYIYYQGTDQYKYPLPYYAAENGPPNFMMRNNRDGTFRDVTLPSGLDRNNTRYSFCCTWNDYNGDGWPDLYVVNDFGRKNLYRNNGDGTFTDVAADAGVEDVGAGMGACWFDYDNDGRNDLYVADMWTAAGSRIAVLDDFQKDAPQQVRALYRKHARGNSLFHNGGEGSLDDISAQAGVEMGRWSWSSDTWDFDHDGYSDLYVVNGMISGPSREDLNSFFWRQVVGNSPVDARPAASYEQGWSAINEAIRSDQSWSGYERNVFYANNRDGTFSDISGVAGLDFIEDGRAFALADFDHDGRLEVILKNRNGPQLQILKNVVSDLAPAIAFRVRGTKSNRDAIGAVITLQTTAGKQTRTLQAGSGFLSQHTKEVFFGLGDARGAVHATIRWPSGLLQEFSSLPINHRILVEEGSDQFRAEPFRSSAAGLKSMPGFNEQNSVPGVIETWLLAPVSAPDFSLPDTSGRVWTLSALRGKPVLVSFFTAVSTETVINLEKMVTQLGDEIQVLALEIPGKEGEPTQSQKRTALVRLRASEDAEGIYNILYRYLFDRHRDLPLPTSFLVDENGEIVKIYQGPADPDGLRQDLRRIPRSDRERVALALPFKGLVHDFEFRRNYLSYGSVYFQRGYFAESEAMFARALQDDPDSAEAHYGFGSALLQRGKNAAARGNFERAVKLKATYPDTLPNSWNNLGLLATREGKTTDAVEYFGQALRLNPNHPIALVNLGNAYRQLQQWEQARPPLERALQLNPDDPDANYSLGMVYAQVGDTDNAYKHLQSALTARPNYPEALNNLGILYLRTGRQNEAVAEFQKCIEIAPAFDQAYLNLAKVYVIEGAPEKARSVLKDLLQQHPGHQQAQELLKTIGR